MIANLFADLRADLIYAVRMLARNPGFTAMAVLTLALGIGANTTIFSMLNSMILKPLPYKDSHQLLRIYNTNEKRGWDSVNLSYPDFLEYKGQTQTLSGMIAFYQGGVNFSTGETARRLRAGVTTPGFFPLLGMSPLLGRTLLPEDQDPASDRVVLLNEEVWRGQYAADRNVIGQQATLSSRKYTIIGVVPAIARMPDVWIPFRRQERDVRSNHYLSVVARMNPDVTIQEVRVELGGIAKQLAQGYPKTNGDYGINVRTLKNALVDRQDRAIVFTLFGLVTFVLLIACANVANLLLARMASRRKEMAIRATLGAGRSRLTRQLLTESVLLSGLGGALGLVVGYWGLQVLVNSLPPYIPRLNEIRMDLWVFAFTAGISILTGIVFGLAPSWQFARPDMNESLKEGGRTSTGAFRARLRSLLAVSQVAVALALLICAGLFLKGFAELAGIDLGFNPNNVLTAETTLPSAKYSSDEQVAGFYRDILQRIRALPGVVSVGMTSKLYLGQGTLARSFIRQGDPIPEPGEAPFAVYYATNPDYLRVMQVGLVRGRYFAEEDERENPKVVLVNETLARRTWPEEDPIGKQIRFYHDEELPRTVVGVVKDTLHGDFDNGIYAQAYVPHRQTPWASMNLAIRTAGDPEAFRVPLQQVFREADADLPLEDVWTMDYRAARQLQGLRVLSIVLGLFGLLALALAIMGIYGVISFGVTQRTHEFGVRMALGARHQDILRFVLKQGMILTGTGIVVGLALAAALSRVMARALEVVDPNDVFSFAAIAFLLVVVALAACYVPARRATRVDPMVALRYE